MEPSDIHRRILESYSANLPRASTRSFAHPPSTSGGSRSSPRPTPTEHGPTSPPATGGSDRQLMTETPSPKSEAAPKSKPRA